MGIRKTALIVVRTYPVPAKKGVEVSCTAAITNDGSWLRLFPVPYRRLAPEQKFHKYQWIDVEVERAADARPESHKIIQQTIKILDSIGTEREWQGRKDVIYSLKSSGLCSIQRKRDAELSPTLGIFRPRITRLIIEQAKSPEWTDDERQLLSQGNLFEDESVEALEKVPFDFRYEFDCEDPGCKGHSLKCTDWELGESWRKWRQLYGEDGWEAAFRNKYEIEMKDRFDTHFYVGTLHQFPNAWIIVGLFYPPKSNLSLFPD